MDGHEVLDDSIVFRAKHVLSSLENFLEVVSEARMSHLLLRKETSIFEFAMFRILVPKRSKPKAEVTNPPQRSLAKALARSGLVEREREAFCKALLLWKPVWKL